MNNGYEYLQIIAIDIEVILHHGGGYTQDLKTINPALFLSANH